MRLQYDHFATTKSDNRKEDSKVSERFYWSCHKASSWLPQGLQLVATLSSETAKPNRSRALLSTHRRLAATDLVAQRFYWSLGGREAVLLSSQIGFRLYGDQFCVEKGGDSLQTSGDLPVTDQQWGRDPSVLRQWLVTNWLQNGFKACADHMEMGL